MRPLLNTIYARLRSTRGESLTEVLAAIVVSGLAILMLATVIAAAANTNRQSSEQMDKYYKASNELVANVASGLSGTVTLNDIDGNTVRLEEAESSVPVEYTVNEEVGQVPIVSYER